MWMCGHDVQALVGKRLWLGISLDMVTLPLERVKCRYYFKGGYFIRENQV